jgi:Carboxylesterase family
MMKVFLAVGTLLLPFLAQASLILVDRDVEAASGILTTSGIIIGHAATNRTGVAEYLGIPYAASTNGSQRWLPPQRFNSTTKFNASTYVSSLGNPLAMRHWLICSQTGPVSTLNGRKNHRTDEFEGAVQPTLEVLWHFLTKQLSSIGYSWLSLRKAATFNPKTA